ncbi:hypothetical protein Tco_0848154 [Tanacetum coccineum]
MATMSENVIVADLTGEDKLRYDSDIKVVNILLLGLPVDIYTIINHYQTAKEIWGRFKELMEGTELTKFTKLINDMRIIPMTMSPMQINMKFVNHLQPEWSRTQATIQNSQVTVQNVQATVNFKADNVDAYDSDCDDEATSNSIFMANLSPVGSLNDDTVEPRYDSDIHSKSWDILKTSYLIMSLLTIGNGEDNYVPPSIQKNDMMLFVIEQMKSQVEKCNMVNQESKSVNESLTSELERYKERVKLLEYAVKDGHSEQAAYLSRTKLYSVTPLPKSKVIPKVVEKNDLSKSVNSHLTTKKIIEKCIKVLAPGLLKIESEPINAYFKNNKAMHRDYLKITKEHVATLQELLVEARALKPLDEHISHASKFVERIQELLVYVSASCPFTQSENEKWGPATRHKRNNKPYVDASRTKPTIKTITKEHAVKQNTRKTDNTMFPSIVADKALKQEVVMAVPIEDGAGHTLERIKLEYEWKPPLCLECHVFGHDSNSFPKKAHEAVKPSSNSGLETKQQDGFTTVTHKKKKTKNQANVQPKQFGGLKLNKPTSTMVWNKKATQPRRVEKGESPNAQNHKDKPATNPTKNEIRYKPQRKAEALFEERIRLANWWRTSEEVDEDINLEEPPGQAMSHANKGNSVPHG